MTSEKATQRRGIFISLEGGEGTGKSTLSKNLKQGLEANGQSVVLTREPGGSPGAEALRNVLLTPPEGCEWSPLTQALIVNAARRDHVENLIEPELAEGKIVLTDRFFDSTRVYQGFVQRLDGFDLKALENVTLRGLTPDLTILLDAAPLDLAQRRADRGVMDMFEGQPMQFHEQVREGFLALSEAEPDRFVVLDALLSENELTQAALDAVRERFSQRGSRR